MRRHFLGAFAVAGCLAVPIPAFAAYSTVFGADLNSSALAPLASTPISDAARAFFLSAAGGAQGNEDFEGQTTGATGPLVLSLTGATPGLSATLTGVGIVAEVVPGTTNGLGRYSVPSATSEKFWDVNATGFTITFNRAISAFGFYGVDVGDFGGTLTMDLRASGTILQTFTVVGTTGTDGSTDGSVLYFGVVSDGAATDFDEIRFTSILENDEIDDVFGFDNFTTAERASTQGPGPGNNGEVSEPGTLALIAVAAAIGARVGRRR